jgi:hypothetical protein
MVAVLLTVTSVVGLVYGQHGLYRPDPSTLPAFLGFPSTRQSGWVGSVY